MFGFEKSSAKVEKEIPLTPEEEKLAEKAVDEMKNDRDYALFREGEVNAEHAYRKKEEERLAEDALAQKAAEEMERKDELN